MGLSSSKSKTTNDPWAPAQPYILKGLEQSSKVFDQQQPELNKYSKMSLDAYGRMAPGAEAGITGAQTLVNDTLSGKYLSGNPYLQSVLDKSNADISDGVSSMFSGAGRYGSGYNQSVLAKALADNENALRYQDYATERGRQSDAIDQAQSLMGGSQSLLNNAAELPWIGVGALNGNVRQASNGYGTQSTTSNPGLYQSLLQGVGTAAKAYSSFSDPRLKTNIRKIGEYADGLGRYVWTYIWGEPGEGVMADEVAKLRPWALGQPVNGFSTVDYGAL